MPTSALPPAFVRAVLDHWGPSGTRWLVELPEILADLAARWNLSVGVPTGALRLAWVAPAVRSDGSAVVLKLALPGDEGLRREAAALVHFDGRGAVRLLDEDVARGALLLARIEPGTPADVLVPRNDEQATAALITTMHRLHTAPDGVPLPCLATYAAAFDRALATRRAASAIPLHLVERASGVFAELLQSPAPPVVLHGDLHHHNLLLDGAQGWCAIDPHGVVGEPAYDSAALLYNPDPPRRDEELLRLVPGRLDQLADGLGVQRDRLVAWGFVQAVLSEVWTFEDGWTPGTRALDVALALLPELP